MSSQLQHSQSSAARYRSVHLLYVLSLVIITSSLIYWSSPFSNDSASRPEPAVVSVDASVQRVVETRHHINDIDVVTPTIHPSTASLPTTFSTTPTTALPSPPESTVALDDPSLMTTSTTYSVSSTAARPLLASSSLSSLYTSSSALPSTVLSTADSSNELSPSPRQSTTADTLDVENYVSFHGSIRDGRGLGNQMFDLAAVVYVAELTGRQPAILKFNDTIEMEEVFDLSIKRFDDLRPRYVFSELRSRSLAYDRRVEELANGSLAEDVRGKSIFLFGYYQSWKYTLNVERRLRHHFTFLPEIRQFVDKFLADSRPPGWVAGYVRVGIHVRRGDVLRRGKEKFGHTTPDERYFAHAMRYFVDRFDRVQFIVASNGIEWCRQKLANFWTTLRHRVNMTFVSPRSAGEDFAVVASCDHVIVSTGSYGWWAAWLARGITIYYADWPRNGSAVASMFKREEYFAPTWIGMT